MRIRWLPFTLYFVALAAHAADAPPASQPAPNLSERQASLFLQLANAEANIATINKALVRTGYKVGLAYEQEEGSAKANELMDRKGGGPVPWDQFYGKTAMGFYHHASEDVAVNIGRGAAVGEDHWVGSRLTRVARPPQFDFIYRANDQQSARAQEQIATLLKDQVALLARRQKHETDQSALWAQLSLESVSDREISFRPLYRFRIAPAGARAGLLRGPILFLRVVDKAASDTLEAVPTDQQAAYTALHARTKSAYAALQESFSAASVAEGATDADRHNADTLKSLCKRVAEECVVITDNHTKALESDKAREDASKLEYRRQLQASLAKLAELIGALDEQTGALAATWSIKPVPGSESEDKLPGSPALTIPPRVTTSIAPSSPPTPSPVATPPADQRDELPALRGLLASSAALKPDTDLPTTDFLKGDCTLPAKLYRLTGALRVGDFNTETPRDSVQADVHFPPGTLIEGGQIVISAGKLHLDGSADHPIIARNVDFSSNWGQRVYADYVVFDHCTFTKHDKLFSESYSVKWAISHSLLYETTWPRLTRQDVGIQLERCALIDCKIPARTFGAKGDEHPDIAARRKDGWNDVLEDSFYHCTIGVPFCWIMSRCNVTDCKVVGDGKFTGKGSVSIEVGQFSKDEGLFDDLTAMTHPADDGRVTYSARHEPYWNPTGLVKTEGAK